MYKTDKPWFQGSGKLKTQLQFRALSQLLHPPLGTELGASAPILRNIFFFYAWPGQDIVHPAGKELSILRAWPKVAKDEVQKACII